MTKSIRIIYRLCADSGVTFPISNATLRIFQENNEDWRSRATSAYIAFIINPNDLLVYLRDDHTFVLEFAWDLLSSAVKNEPGELHLPVFELLCEQYFKFPMTHRTRVLQILLLPKVPISSRQIMIFLSWICNEFERLVRTSSQPEFDTLCQVLSKHQTRFDYSASIIETLSEFAAFLVNKVTFAMVSYRN